MNREQIIQMAREAGFERLGHTDEDWVCYPEDIEAFAALVAKHTLANIDPSSFMSWQEGYEAGKQTEREACAKLCEDQADDGTEGVWDGCCLFLARHIRERGQE